MKNWIKVGLVLGLMSLAVVAVGAELPFKTYTIDAITHHVEIANNTAGHLKVFVIFFAEPVVVTQAITYGPGAPAVEEMVGNKNGGKGWRIVLAGKGLAPGAFLRVAYKGPAGIAKVIAQ